MGADDLDWDDLRYFLRAVQSKTLAGAAREMGARHTTVGRRLSALERALGAPLVLRGPDGLRLTPLGEKLAPLVEQVERSVIAVREIARAERPRIRLAAPSGLTQLFAAGLAALRKDHPAVSLELLSGARPVDLGKGEADLAIRSGPVAGEDLVVRKLCESGFSLYASDVYLTRRPAPTDLDDLRGHELIGYDRSLAAVPAAQWIEARAAQATVVLRSREMTEMLQATIAGAGLAVLPCMLGDGEPSLRRLTEDVLVRRNLSLVYRRELKLSAEVRAVVRFVVDVMHEHKGRISGKRGDR